MLLRRSCTGCASPRGYPCGSCVARLVAARSISVPGAASAAGVVAYDDVSRLLIGEAKSPWGGSLLRWWAAGLAATCPDEVDVVCWIPASMPGRRLRGHDHGQVLAREVGRLLGRPKSRQLVRHDSIHQTGRSRSERLDGPSLGARAGASGRRILLLDDVHTTGSTIRAGVGALLGQGAAGVHVRVLAVVPDEITTFRADSARRPTTT